MFFETKNWLAENLKVKVNIFFEMRLYVTVLLNNNLNI